MKNKTTLLVFLILVLYFSAGGQTYIAHYKCYYGKGIKFSDIIKTRIDMDSTEILSIDLIINYTIKSDGKYMLAEAEIDSLSASFFPMNYTVTKALFDLSNNIVYFPNEHKVKKVKLYELKMIASMDSCTEYLVADHDTSYKVVSCDNLPNYLLPAVQFKNFYKGIQLIVTPNFSIFLREYKKLNEKMDYRKVFEPFLTKKIIEEYRFLE